LLRPGRLDRLIYIQPPDREARQRIFEVHLRGKPIGGDIAIEELARITDKYVGADIAAIVKEAVMAALREFLASGIPDEQVTPKASQQIIVMRRHFEAALRSVKPTLSPQAQAEFEVRAEDLVKHAYA
jgi:transitional endoplasmic reticulum ATPase